MFLYIDHKEQTLNIMKFPSVFDPKLTPECVENYLIKQMIFENKSVKKACIFNQSPQNRYLVLALFT